MQADMQGPPAKDPAKQKAARYRWHTLNAQPKPPGKHYGDVEKLELERLIGRMLKSTKTPVQYKSALASSLSTLKGWTKYAGDDKRIDIAESLNRWASERVYAAGNKPICGDELKQESCQLGPAPAGVDDGGGIPQEGVSGNGSMVSQITPADKKLEVTVDSKEVSKIDEFKRPEPLDL